MRSPPAPPPAPLPQRARVPGAQPRPPGADEEGHPPNVTRAGLQAGRRPRPRSWGALCSPAHLSCARRAAICRRFPSARCVAGARRARVLGARGRGWPSRGPARRVRGHHTGPPSPARCCHEEAGAVAARGLARARRIGAAGMHASRGGRSRSAPVRWRHPVSARREAAIALRLVPTAPGWQRLGPDQRCIRSSQRGTPADLSRRA